MAPVCKFWRQGNCRNGANCRFDHPPSEAPSNQNHNPFAATNSNRFGALSGGNDNSKDVQNPYKITKENIKIDLTEERPFWILSSYGPGKDAPEQLFGGYPREQSFEELRLFVTTHANQQEGLQHVQQLYQQAESQIQATLGNLDGAVQFLVAAENRHPNRHDIIKQSSQGGDRSGAFGSGIVPSGLAANPLNPSAPATQNPFSAPKSNPFGAPSSTTSSAFGQPSALGKPGGFGAPAFGQPSMPGAVTAPAFGAPSQLGAAGNAFGQPSALGAKPNPFGATAAPSGFGQTAQQPNSAFGAPSTLGAKPNPFASNQPPAQALQPPPNPFSTVNGAAQTATGQRVNPFTAPSSTNAAASDLAMDTADPPPAAMNPFSRPTGSGFAAQANPSGFAATTNPSRFAQLQQPAAPAQTTTDPYAPGSAKKHPPVSAYSSQDMSGKLVMFKGRPVVYNDDGKPGVRNPDGSWRKIWFPDGAPAYYRGTEAEDPSQYTGDIKSAYASMAQGARFAGDMPEVPPMREDCTWDF